MRVYIIQQNVQYMGTNGQWRHREISLIVYIRVSAPVFLYTLVLHT